MSETWFTSDTHFGHKNILVYEKDARPFTTVEEMNECIIERWNATVGDGDLVYHLGDFAFGKRYIDLAARLKGKKRLILGNHDNYPSACYLAHFEKLYGMTFWERCVLSHMPVHPHQLGARWWINVHGHLHSKLVMVPVINKGTGLIIDKIVDENYFNVSCEQNNLTPINADVIRQRIKDLD